MNHKNTDVGIITVIGAELEAVQKALTVNSIEDRSRQSGDIYWQASLYSKIMKRNLNIVIHCLSSAGESAASNGTTKLIDRFNPTFALLVGIAAGRKGEIRIGDVAIPRTVVDYTIAVEEITGKKYRPTIPEVPHQVSQILRAFTLDRENWHQEFSELFNDTIVVPAGYEEEYRNHVTTKPNINECAIASSDTLLRNPSVLNDLSENLSQNIKIGEMESGGFVKACASVLPNVPWFIIRGVSDFGDSMKNDSFHRLAASSAASYMKCFLVNGLDLYNLGDRSDLGVSKTYKKNKYEMVNSLEIANLLKKCLSCTQNFSTIDIIFIEQLNIINNDLANFTEHQSIKKELAEIIELTIKYNQFPRKPGLSDPIRNFIIESRFHRKITAIISRLEEKE